MVDIYIRQTFFYIYIIAVLGVWGVSTLFPQAWFDAEITLRQQRLDSPWPRWLLITLRASASKTDPDKKLAKFN